MKKILAGVLMLLILGTMPTYAGSFYTPTEQDSSLLEKVEEKIALLKMETIPLLENKIQQYITTTILSLRGKYIIDIVGALLAHELQERSLSNNAEGTLSVENHNKKIILHASKEHEALFKRLDGYRYNKQ